MEERRIHSDDYALSGGRLVAVKTGQRFRCIQSCHGLATDMAQDHGAVIEVFQDPAPKGEEVIRVLFAAETYTGAVMVSPSDACRAFELMITYIRHYNGDLLPRRFRIAYGIASFDEKEMIAALKANDDGLFPGARKMGMPLKEAVEAFIVAKYATTLGAGLTKKDIWREDRKLYQALNEYKRVYGYWPFDIPSERQLVQRDLEQMYKQGIGSLTSKQRTAVVRRGRRDLSKLCVE